MGAATEAELWRGSLQDEVDSAHVYRALADREGDSVRGAAFRALAEDEARHAAVCEERLRALGAAPGPAKPTRRARILAALGRRFGARFVLSALESGEAGAQTTYGAIGDEHSGAIAADERRHAQTLRDLTAGAPPESAHPERHRLGAGNTLRASVLGANDGLLSNFSLVMGVAGADLSNNAILLTGLSGLLAGAGSMALGEWISVQSSREYYEHELDVERRELELMPEEELAELTRLYVRKGVDPDDAARLAARLLSDPERALDTMAREELGIDPTELGGSPWGAAASSFVLFAVGAIIPVVPYVFLGGAAALATSAALSGLGLFGIGAAITLVTGRSVLRSGLRQVAFGIGAAAVTYAVGALLGTAVSA